MRVQSDSNVTNSTNMSEEELEHVIYRLYLSWVGYELVPLEADDVGDKTGQ